jgi:hypothetical protein
MISVQTGGPTEVQPEMLTLLRRRRAAASDLAATPAKSAAPSSTAKLRRKHAKGRAHNHVSRAPMTGLSTQNAFDQNGISSSMSSRLPPAPAIAGLRAAVGPGEPKSSEALALPPARSSMVSCELKPCSTTSVE